MLALQKTSHWEETIGLVDYLEDADKNSYFLMKFPKVLLSSYCAKIK